MPGILFVNDCWEAKEVTSSICIHTWSQSCPNLMMTTRDSSCRQEDEMLVSPALVSGRPLTMQIVKASRMVLKMQKKVRLREARCSQHTHRKDGLIYSKTCMQVRQKITHR